MMELKEIEKRIIERTITKITSLATKIRVYCFYSYSSLTSASFPSATSIGKYAFYSCRLLTTVDFPNATNIGIYAFCNCTALTDISFPNVTSIDDAAFRNCAALTTADFPLVTELYANDFSDCPKLKLFIGTTGGFPLVQSVVGNRTGTYRDINVTISELHITGTTLTNLGDINTKTTKIYFEYVDGDTYNFTPALTKGASKSTKSYGNLFTDNTIIKNTLMSFADEYTTVSVKHLDGSDW